ncbi:MAG: NAD-dependent deacylase [Planctomycetota bacterium]
MRILILTGAGISAESGIATFRGADGLWEGHRPEDVATPQAFARDPALVQRFYNERRRKLQSPEIQPNAAHRSLAEFEAKHYAESRNDEFLLVTQNIDDLHQRAGSQNVLPMHGELLKIQCELCKEVIEWTNDLDPYQTHDSTSKDEDCPGRLRPNVVWFGEMPIGLSRIDRAARQADVFLTIGTSGLVYPAAGIVQSTPPNCQRVEINLDDTPVSMEFGEVIRGKASEEVPRFLRSLA